MRNARQIAPLLVCLGCIAASVAHGQKPDSEPRNSAARGADMVDEQPIRPRRKLAFCVGINEYAEGSGYKSLQFAGNDAAEMARTLLKDCQFDQVVLASDAKVPEELTKEFPAPRLDTTADVTRSGIRDRAESLFAEATNRDDIVLFYFAGHGNAGDNGPFLVAADKPLLLGTVLDAMRQPPTQAQNRVLVLDACRSSPLDAGGTVLAPAFLQSLALEEPRCVIWCGCGAQESSYEDAALQHGRFTWAVLQALRGKAYADGQERLMVSDVAKHIQQTFAEQVETKAWPAGQTPRLYTAHLFSLAQRRLPKPRAFGNIEWKKLTELQREADDSYRRNALEDSSELYQLCLRAIDSRLTAQADASVTSLHGNLLAKRARVLYRTQEAAEAQTLVEQARKLTPGSLPLAEYDAYRLLADGNLDDSKKRFEKILPSGLPPQETPPYLWSQYGELLVRMQDFPGASTAFATATNLYLQLQQLGDAAAQLHRSAACLAEAGDHARAKELLRQAAELVQAAGGDPPSLDRADVQDGLSACLQQSGQVDGALKFAEQSLALRQKLQPNLLTSDVAAAQARVGTLQVALGQFDQAQPHLMIALKAQSQLGDEHPAILASLDGMGDVLTARGKYRDAELCLRLSLATREQVHGQRHPASAPTLRRLAALYQKSGDKDQAAVALSSLAQMYKNERARQPLRLEQVVESLAKSIAEQLGAEKAINGIDVQLGPQFPAAAEDRLKADLLAALEKQEIKVDRKATLKLDGHVRIEPPEPGSQIGVEVAFDLRLQDELGSAKPLTDATFQIAPRDALVLAGLAGSLPSPASLGETQRQVARLLDGESGQLDVRGTVIKASPSAKFAIELLAYDPADKKPNYRPVLPAVDGDSARLVLREGDAYAVRIHNDEDFEIAVDLRINGFQLTRFADKESMRHASWIIPAKSKRELKGWYLSNSETTPLQVNNTAQSATSLLANDRPGSIYASYRAAWTKGKAPPDEPRDPEQHAVGAGTNVNTSPTNEPLHFGEIRGAIGVELNR